jgi:hypothetical protein
MGMQCWVGGLFFVIVGCGSSGSSGAGGKPDGGGGAGGAAGSSGSGGATVCDPSVTISGVGALPSVAWTKVATVEPHAVAIDSEGNVFVGGELALSEDLGGGPLTGSFPNDAFLVSYAASGEHRWSKRFGGPGYDRFFGVGVDASGNVYATGEFTPGADLGAGPLASNKVLVASFGNDGAYRWATELGVSRAMDLVVQPDGIVYVTGDFGGTIDIGGKPLTSAGYVDGFLASLDAQGAHRWAMPLGGSSNDYGAALATDGSGVAVIGSFYETASLGSGSVTSAGQTDVFVASIDSSGGYRWSRSIGVAGSDSPGGIALANGVVHVSGSLEIGGSDERDPFLWSFDDAGAEGAKLEPSGPGFAVGTALARDAASNVYAAGRFGGTTDVGGGELVAKSSTGVWFASYGSALEHRWSIALDWVGPPSGPDHLAIAPGGAIYAIGSFSILRESGRTPVPERPFLIKLVENCPE